MEKNKLLIACHFFPPNPSIGGRRSAKFAKYLSKMGYDIFVVHAKNPYPSVSPWIKDVDGVQNIHRFELPLKYPIEFMVPPKSFVGKIKYKVFDYFFHLFYSRKNKFDYTIFWERTYLRLMDKLITKYEIKNILVSGPPFYYAYYTIKLKEKFPSLNIIVDFRDPWIGSPYYGMLSLSKKQLAHEVKMLNSVFLKSDYFIGPNKFILELQEKYIDKKNGKGAKMIEVPHGYDLDELNLNQVNKNATIQQDTIKMIYGGQLYPGTDSILIAFAASLSMIKREDKILYEKLRIEFYTPECHKKALFAEHESVVKFFEPIGSHIFQKVSEADICLIILAEHNKDYRTTKFLEYSLLRKPFLILGEKGFVSEFVETNVLGRAYDETDMKGVISFLSGFHDFNKNNFNREFDFSNYEFGRVSEIIANILVR